MRGRLMFALAALIALAAGAMRPALAAPAPPPDPDPDSSVPETAPPPPDAETELTEPTFDASDGRDALGDRELGPVIQIEQIEVTGNTATDTEVIRRALPISAGDVLSASDRRLREARFKVLALGFFRDVALAMRKGSQRGHVVVEVRVVERGTLMLNRLWFGRTDASPWWVGADIGDRNLLGLGIAVGGGFIYANQIDLARGRNQYAAELRVSDPSVGGTRFGTTWSATVVRGSEPYRISDAGTVEQRYRAFPYRRYGVRIAGSYNVSALTRVSTGVRLESIDAALPVAPTLVQSGGATVPVDLHLSPGTSRVVTASLAFDRDTRPDPILPHTGSRLLASAELGNALIGSSYDFATIFGSYEHHWPLRGERHAIALKIAGGLVIGNAPWFDRIHVADVDRMLTPRALGLVLSTAAPLAILGTRGDKPTYGDVGGSAAVEYAFQLFRGSGKQRIYGSDIFFGAGLWGLAERNDLRVRDTGVYASLPIDVFIDAGMRIDTDIGTFELAIANGLGRLR